jgi:hypothetical protein
MFATSGRARLACECTGAEDGADVLLIRAGVNDRRSWHHVVGRLKARHRCVAYDMRGYGETTYEREDGWSPVADALAVLDAAEVERAVVVAGSMGGRAARERFLDMNARSLRAEDPGEKAEIPGARLQFLEGVAHVPYLEGDPTTLDEITAFVDAFG